VNQKDVTACLVTRGDIDLKPILETLIFPHVIVWDNSERQNIRTASRYAAISEAKTPVVYVQDDDTILGPDQQRALLDNYQPGRIVANMAPNHQPPHLDGLVFVGWGALFDQGLPRKAFDRAMPDRYDLGFQMVGCDILFTMLTPTTELDLGQTNLPEAFGPDRAHRHPRHNEWKTRYYNMAKELG
jgi:hypothetical protein